MATTVKRMPYILSSALVFKALSCTFSNFVFRATLPGKADQALESEK